MPILGQTGHVKLCLAFETEVAPILTPMREPLQGRCIGDGYGDDEVSCANELLLALSRGVAAKACRKAPRALTSPRSLSLAGRTQIGVAPGGGSVTELFVFREPKVCRLVWEFFCQVVFCLFRFLVWSGKAVPRPVACDQVRGARGRCQGTEMLAQLSGLPLSVACVSQRLDT